MVRNPLPLVSSLRRMDAEMRAGVPAASCAQGQRAPGPTRSFMHGIDFLSTLCMHIFLKAYSPKGRALTVERVLVEREALSLAPTMGAHARPWGARRLSPRARVYLSIL